MHKVLNDPEVVRAFEAILEAMLSAVNHLETLALREQRLLEVAERTLAHNTTNYLEIFREFLASILGAYANHPALVTLIEFIDGKLAWREIFLDEAHK